VTPPGPAGFVSTHGGDARSFTEALFAGLAPDGGLYVPSTVRHFEPGDRPPTDSFGAAAAWGIERLLARAPGEVDYGALAAEALDFPLPLVEIEPGVHLLELFHGPSLAFKDVGARFMARAMAARDDAQEGGTPRTVLVATSGDTGGAVAAAFHGLPGYRVVTLFPDDGISERQRRQMSTLAGNVLAVAVQGCFDDCQRLAKAAFMDAELAAAHRLTSANSINIGRLLPQTLYYLYASALLGWSEAPASFVVPSGNLGNLCAGLWAHRAGMPARGFLAVSNANDVFPVFLASGRFEARPSVRTLSNAMDVGDPSNLERIRWLYRDEPEALHRVVRGASVDDDATRETIRSVHEQTGYVLDPHTAVAYHAQALSRLASEGPVIVLATAHPAKFPEVVEPAIGAQVALPLSLTELQERPERVRPMRPTLDALTLTLESDFA
jgi:threonine synthase